MADYSESKPISTASYPVYANADSGLVKRVEPLTTAKQIKSRFLKGINLKFPNGDEITDEDIKDKINVALNNIELELGVPIVATQFKDRMAFDKDAYRSYIFLKPKKKPILSVENLSIETTDGANIFKIPPDWIDSGRFLRGQINVIPFLASYTGNIIAAQSANAGIILLASMGGVHWIPGYWTVTYTSGLCKELGQVPIPVNYLIGIETALIILSQLGPTKEFTSVSLGQDGISQSSSGPGNMLYAKRMEDLEKEKENLIKKIKGAWATKWHIFDF
jgi:hypothetical protein